MKCEFSMEMAIDELESHFPSTFKSFSAKEQRLLSLVFWMGRIHGKATAINELMEKKDEANKT